MSFDEKVDVIDLIINVLKEHEKTLDELISRLDEILSRGFTTPSMEAKPPERPVVTVDVRNWMDFRDRCRDARLAAFEVVDGRFRVSALKDNILYIYEEEMPEMSIRFREEGERTVIDGIDLRDREQFSTAMRGRLKCGLDISINGVTVNLPEGISLYKLRYTVDPIKARRWLSEELNIDEDEIVEGEIHL